MDAQQFLAEFGHIANAPGGVGKLRELVLAFAVQGTLVKQDAADESAIEWLSCLAVKKAELLKQKKIAKQTAFLDIPENEHPYSLPRGWAFARLGAITNKIGSGSTPRGGREVYVRAGVPFLRSQNIWNDGIRLDDVAFITPAVHENMDGSAVKGNDILLNITGASLGRCALVPTDFGDANVSQHVTIIRPTDSAIRAYLHLCMLSPYTQAMIWERQVGMAREGLSKKVLEQFEIPLPPVNEQSRIVAKVDELMALCDQLEAQQQQRRSLQNKLRQSTLQAVAEATNPHELQATWARLADNFDQFFHAPEDVDDFIAHLKNKAVRGLLSLPSQAVPELDEIVSACDGTRAKYIAAGLMRRQKIVSHAETDVVYPSHWEIAPFDKVAIVIGGVTKGRNLRGRAVLTCPYLAVANVQRGFFRLHALKTIEIGVEELDKYLVKEGDLLITEGGDWDKVGRTAIWRGGVENCLHQNHIFKARVPSKALRNEWVELVFNSGVGRDYFAGASKQTTNLASINMTQLRGFPLPVPPLDEQLAILEKLADLTARCNEWREQLDRKQTLASLLAAATIASITGIANEPEEDAPLKAPQTELIAPLRLDKTPDIKAQAPLATILARHQGELAAKDLWQRFGGEIDAFYAQLKQEVAHGWILEPAVAEMRSAG